MPNGVPIAFTGRVPVYVTDENGTVASGDYLTLSKTRPGYAMKLVGEGRAIGIALSGGVINQEKVLMLVQVGNHKLNLDGRTASTTAMLTTGNTDLNANGVAIINIKAIFSANDTWSIDDTGRVQSKKVATQELCIDDVCVTKDTLRTLLERLQISFTGAQTAQASSTDGNGGGNPPAGGTTTSTPSTSGGSGNSSAGGTGSSTPEVPPTNPENNLPTGGGDESSGGVAPPETPATGEQSPNGQ
jgi:hypothetical protein